MASSSTSNDAEFRVRVVKLQHYAAQPVQGLDPTFARSKRVRRVPVIRVFGATPDGRKCCVHVHGVFPYLYAPMPDAPVAGFAHKLAQSLDKALNLSLGRQDDAGERHHVFKVLEVGGIPFYGYHAKTRNFIKIFFYDPKMAKRASDILLNGGVMAMKLQPHESHVPFALQFMMDYNVQGMNYLRLARVKPREGALKQMTTCDLELDAVAADVLNVVDCEASDSRMNPGLEAIWADERRRRRAMNRPEKDMMPPASPPRPEKAEQPTPSHFFWKEKFKEKLESLMSEAENSTDGSLEVTDKLPRATRLECHVPPLGQHQDSLEPDEEEAHEETIVDEAVIAQSTNEDRDSQRPLSQKAKERIARDEQDEIEMSQIWEMDTEDEDEDGDLWKGDRSFWNNLTFND